jgi:hypothetical protein
VNGRLLYRKKPVLPTKPKKKITVDTIHVALGCQVVNDGLLHRIKPVL